MSKLSCPGQDRAVQGQPGQSHRWAQVSGSARVEAPLEEDDSDSAVLKLLQLNCPEMAFFPWLLTTAALPISLAPDVWYTFQLQPKHQGPALHKQSKNQCFPMTSEKRTLLSQLYPEVSNPKGRCLCVPSGQLLESRIFLLTEWPL